MKAHVKKFLKGARDTGIGIFMFGLLITIITLLIIGSGVQDSSQPMLLVYAVIAGLILGGMFGVLADDEDDSLTEHKCDICSEMIKKGEGKHYLNKEEGGCHCVFPRCEPTVVSKESKQ